MGEEVDAVMRRKEIQRRLQSSSQPIKGSQLAKDLQVSRQVIVQDIAILRAGGIQVVATPTGYLIQGVPSQGILKTICCQHGESLKEISDELETIVAFGGKVIDVIVEHPIYGEIRAVLNITCLWDVQQFIENVKTNRVKLLSILTEGLHYHTLEVTNEAMFRQIKEALKKRHYLK